MKLHYASISLAGLAIASTLLALPLAASAASLTAEGTRLVALTATASGAFEVPEGVIGTDTSAGVQGHGDTGIQSGDGSMRATITSSDQVKTDDDFNTFAKAEVGDDADVKAVDTTPASVSVTFHDHARFLGIFPATLAAVTTVNADGSINFHYPWYHFLFATHRAQIQSQFQTMTHASSTSITMGATLTAEQKARILKGMHSILSAQLSAEANASANAQ